MNQVAFQPFPQPQPFLLVRKCGVSFLPFYIIKLDISRYILTQLFRAKLSWLAPIFKIAGFVNFDQMSQVPHSILATHHRRLAGVTAILIILLVYTCFYWIFAESDQLPFDRLFKRNDRGQGSREVSGLKQRGLPSMLHKRAPPVMIPETRPRIPTKEPFASIGDRGGKLPANPYFPFQTVELIAETLFDDLDFDHSLFLSVMSPESDGTYQTKGISILVCIPYDAALEGYGKSILPTAAT